jgi:hypothetical protein
MTRKLWEFERDINHALSWLTSAKTLLRENLPIPAFEKLQGLQNLLIDIRDEGVKGAKN